ncbi:MAG: hypothetical protein ACTSX0_13745 [Promethearchaeota archaeon]
MESIPKILFINLSNGLEAVEEFNLKNFRIIRIQSTACEQKRWNYILESLSDEFLFYAALGYECIVYDYGCNKEVPRAVWQGLEWIKFVLHARWLNEEYVLIGRASNSTQYFKDNYLLIPRTVMKRLDYYKKFSDLKEIKISSITKRTIYDSDHERQINWAKNLKIS